MPSSSRTWPKRQDAVCVAGSKPVGPAAATPMAMTLFASCVPTAPSIAADAASIKPRLRFCAASSGSTALESHPDISPKSSTEIESLGPEALANELYIGRLVWNRQRYMKDPATGKRRSRPNPETDWVTTEVPDL